MTPTVQLSFREIADSLSKFVLDQVDRAFALMDRDPSSTTFGSMDRTFWYYRTLTNFPSAAWQQPMVAFAALYRTDHPANPWHGDRAALHAAEGALRAWAAAQHTSGAFDEWYKNEHAYCPTAITGAGAATAIRILGQAIDSDVEDLAVGTLERSGEWLRNRYNPTVMNQNLASGVALAGLASLTGHGRWRDAAEQLFARIATDQNAEGWFPEYRGFDFGYSTLALDFLAIAGDFGFAEQTDPLARRLLTHLLSVVDGERAIPGRLGSRGTSHVFPYGAIHYADRVDGAASLLYRFMALHERGAAARPAGVDDRYFAYFYFPAFCLAYKAAAEHTKTERPSVSVERIGSGRSVDQPESGLVIRRDKTGSLYVSRRLGGAMALVGEKGAPLYHLGYTVVSPNGRRYSSAHWRADPVLDGADVEEIRVTTPLVAVSGGQPLKRLMIPFQIVIHALVLSRVAEAFQGLVKKRMVAPKKTFDMTLERRIAFSNGHIAINDRLVSGKSRGAVLDILVTPSITMHSPSARQDRGESMELPIAARTAAVRRLNASGSVSLVWSISDQRATVTIDLEKHDDAPPP